MPAMDSNVLLVSFPPCHPRKDIVEMWKMLHPFFKAVRAGLNVHSPIESLPSFLHSVIHSASQSVSQSLVC